MIEIVHHIPGRVRLRAPSARGNPAVAAGLEAAAASLEGVLSAAASSASGSVLILFDPANTSIADIRDRLGRGWTNPLPSAVLLVQTKPKGGLWKARKRRRKIVRRVLEVMAGIVIERIIEVAIRTALHG